MSCVFLFINITIDVAHVKKYMIDFDSKDFDCFSKISFGNVYSGMCLSLRKILNFTYLQAIQHYYISFGIMICFREISYTMSRLYK